jgi:hypothetical protein
MVCTGGKNNNVGDIKLYAPYDHSDMSDWLSNPRRPQIILPSQQIAQGICNKLC